MMMIKSLTYFYLFFGSDIRKPSIKRELIIHTPSCPPLKRGMTIESGNLLNFNLGPIIHCSQSPLLRGDLEVCICSTPKPKPIFHAL